jgi:DNA-binding HxlR family transcriptional regulator
MASLPVPALTVHLSSLKWMHLVQREASGPQPVRVERAVFLARRRLTKVHLQTGEWKMANKCSTDSPDAIEVCMP